MSDLDQKWEAWTTEDHQQRWNEQTRKLAAAPEQSSEDFAMKLLLTIVGSIAAANLAIVLADALGVLP